MKIQIKNKERYFDGWIYKGYEDVKNKLIKKDWDWVTIVDGLEGSGKSTIAQQVAVLVDPTFNLDRVVFNPEDFKKAIHKSKPYQAIIYDEAYNTMSSGKAMHNAQKSVLSMLAEIRQKNLFLFFCCPTFFDIIKNLAMWRSKTLIHCYTDEQYNRGYFRAYNTTMKNQLYIQGKKYYSYSAGQKPFKSIRGRFTKWLGVPEKAYRAKKLEALNYYDCLLYTSPSPRD